MKKRCELVFDEVILKQLKKAAKNKETRILLTKMLDKIELAGPTAGKLIDSQLFLYEIKSKQPPIRLYYKYNKEENKAYVFEYQIKKSEKKQQQIINKLLRKLKS